MHGPIVADVIMVMLGEASDTASDTTGTFSG